VRADVAILWDWESFWAQDLDWRPSVDLGHRERIEAFYSRLWADRLPVDFAHPEADLSGYRLVLAPQLYLLGAEAAKNLGSFVAEGGHLLVSYFSGVVDANDGVHPEGLSGPLGDVLGVDVEEFAPLRAGESVTLTMDEGSTDGLHADVWSEHLRVRPGTEVLGRFADGPAAGGAALTRRELGQGTAWYLATRLADGDLAAVLDLVYAAAGLTATRDLPPGLDVVDRWSGRTRYRFLVNNGAHAAQVPTGPGHELLTDGPVPPAGVLDVPAGAVRVVRTTT
jgi:beta-galactosidase